MIKLVEIRCCRWETVQTYQWYPGWWLQPLWNILVGMIIPNIWKNKTCSKPPTSIKWYQVISLGLWSDAEHLRTPVLLCHWSIEVNIKISLINLRQGHAEMVTSGDGCGLSAWSKLPRRVCRALIARKRQPRTPIVADDCGLSAWSKLPVEAAAEGFKPLMAGNRQPRTPKVADDCGLSECLVEAAGGSCCKAF